MNTVTLTLSTEQLNTILTHLDLGPHNKVRGVIDFIIAEVNRQNQPQETPAAQESVAN
jgi:hypothetical protein